MVSPTLPSPPLSIPLSFQTNQWEGWSDPVRGKFPGFPLLPCIHVLCIPPCVTSLVQSPASSTCMSEALLSVYPDTVPPSPAVVERVRSLGLWAVCRLRRTRYCLHSYLCRYRGRRAGRQRRFAATYRVIGNGETVITSNQNVPRTADRWPSKTTTCRVHVDQHAASTSSSTQQPRTSRTLLYTQYGAVNRVIHRIQSHPLSTVPHHLLHSIC